MPGFSLGAIKGLGTLISQVEAIAGFDRLRSLHAGAEQILPYMQSITPVDTGELRDSEKIIDNGDTVELTAEADHATYVEFGTYKMSARPFMRRAIERKQRDALGAMASDIKQQFKELIGG